ncbi:THAP domain-containing protein 6 [Austrofundulus limnaeus]|uniref:THAP domain-containing protein 1 n=1 Tax=Austrofundulus limnaeus TaxID=52670 RepID=A0A2I4BX29_AUSLI|nr:PREDICTED: THAP domain-containing protein 6-like [Austrofundulus limnaeus]
MDHKYFCADSKKRKIDTSGTECYAVNCNTYQNPQTKAQGITFHKFPDKTKNKDRYYTWVRNCRRHSEPSPSSRICSQHFEPEMINRTLQRAQLREGAVPTIFSLPDHLRHKKTKLQLTKTSTKAIKPLEMPAPESPDEAPLTQDHDNSDKDVKEKSGT